MNRLYLIDGVFKNIVNNNYSKLLLKRIDDVKYINLKTLKYEQYNELDFYCDVFDNLNMNHKVTYFCPIDFMKYNNIHEITDYEIYKDDKYFNMKNLNNLNYIQNSNNVLFFLEKDQNIYDEYERNILSNVAF